MSQTDDNFTSYSEEVSQIPDCFDSQTNTNTLQELAILGSRRHTPYKLFDPKYADIGLPVIPILQGLKPNPNLLMPKATSDESSSTNNIRTENARSKVPGLHQSHSVREVVEQEHGQSKRDYPQVIRRTPYKLFDPRYADIGLPIIPILRGLKPNPNLLMPKATSDESSSTNNIRTENTRSKVPRLHQSSSHSGREIVEQEHRLSRRDYPQEIRRPRYADIGLPIIPILRELKPNPNLLMPKAVSDEGSSTNNIRTDYARSRVPRLNRSSSHSEREVVEQERRLSRRDHPRVIRSTPYKLYDPRYADIGLPVDPILRAFKLNPNFGLPSTTTDEKNEIVRESNGK